MSDDVGWTLIFLIFYGPVLLLFLVPNRIVRIIAGLVSLPFFYVMLWVWLT